jgi:murein DD-endopeptidase MepM/ murein hydrolase activator NlpD
MSVSASQRVQRGQEIGRVGHPEGGPNHLHFDISPTTALLVRPSDWPGLDRPRLLLHYVDPRAFIQVHRP